VKQGSDGGPALPHLHGQLPPASVTDPESSTASGPDGSESVDPSTQVPTANDVQHTVQHLTDGLTDKSQNDVASTVSDTANNLLDAVGQVGNQVAGTLDDTVGGIQSAVPTLP
jgi:cytoskeletal protein RodZ